MSKYCAIRTEVDGIVFASKKEAARYQELNMLKRTGYITALTLQPRYPIYFGKAKICDYVADFTYLTKDQKVVVEDCKGFKTPVYRLKAKMFAACYPDLRITEL